MGNIAKLRQKRSADFGNLKDEWI